MKNIQIKLFILFLLFAQLGFSQDSSIYEFKYEVNRVYNLIHISKEKLMEAESLMDLNSRYKSSWVEKYISVEISALQKGMLKKAASKTALLTPEQKNLMNLADVGTSISVQVKYIPENSLKNNQVRDMEFSFMVEPDSEATFPGGKTALKQYLKKHIADKIDKSSIKKYQVVAANFTIDETGHVINAQTFDTSVYDSEKEDKTDEILLQAICNMPRWKPAEFANGTKVKQEFALSVGDHESCIINLLNIGKLSNGELRQ